MLWTKIVEMAGPWAWRALAIAALAGLIFGAGYSLCYRDKQAELTTFKEAVTKAAADQQAENEVTEALQKRNAEEERDDYQKRLDGLRRGYAGWVPVNASGGAVPIVACRPGGGDGATTDVVSVEEYRSLAGACAQTTLMLVKLQALWLKNQAR